MARRQTDAKFSGGANLIGRPGAARSCTQRGYESDDGFDGAWPRLATTPSVDGNFAEPVDNGATPVARPTAPEAPSSDIRTRRSEAGSGLGRPQGTCLGGGRA